MAVLDPLGARVQSARRPSRDRLRARHRRLPPAPQGRARRGDPRPPGPRRPRCRRGARRPRPPRPRRRPTRTEAGRRRRRHRGRRRRAPAPLPSQGEARRGGAEEQEDEDDDESPRRTRRGGRGRGRRMRDSDPARGRRRTRRRRRSLARRRPLTRRRRGRRRPARQRLGLPARRAARPLRRRRLHLRRAGAPLRARRRRHRDRPRARPAPLRALPVARPRRHDQRPPGRRGRRGHAASRSSPPRCRPSASRSAATTPRSGAIVCLTPIGKGSRVTIVGPSFAGKTEALRRLALALQAQEGVEVSVVLAGVRPEELAGWTATGSSRRSRCRSRRPPTPAARPSSAPSTPPAASAARGGHAVLLIDTPRRPARPTAPASALGAARAIIDGGSLTVIATRDGAARRGDDRRRPRPRADEHRAVPGAGPRRERDAAPGPPRRRGGRAHDRRGARERAGREVARAMAVAADPIPTERARELVRGGFDTHIHVAPDVIPRRIDDITLAGLFAARGLAGFVLKSHYAPTAERAAGRRRRRARACGASAPSHSTPRSAA